MVCDNLTCQIYNFSQNFVTLLRSLPSDILSEYFNILTFLHSLLLDIPSEIVDCCACVTLIRCGEDGSAE